MPNIVQTNFGWGTAAPTDNNYHEAGEYIRNSEPGNGKVTGWLCTVSGRPGTWVAEGRTNGGVIGTVTAAAALSAATNLHNITGAGQYTIFSAASLAAGASVNVVANGVTITLNPATSQTLIGGSTLASVGSTWVSNGANTFFRVA